MISERYSLTLAVSWICTWPCARLLHRQEELHGERHGHEIDERRAEQEQDRRGDEERQEGLALAAIEPRRHEHVDLRGDHREGDEDGAEQSELHLGEEEFLRRGVDHLDRGIDAGRELVGPEQQIVDVAREIEADGEGDEDGEASTRSAGAGARSDAPSAGPWWPRCRRGSRRLSLARRAWRDAFDASVLRRSWPWRGRLGARLRARGCLRLRPWGSGAGSRLRTVAASGFGSITGRSIGARKIEAGRGVPHALHGLAHLVDLGLAHGFLELALEVGGHAAELARIMAEGAHQRAAGPSARPR